MSVYNQARLLIISNNVLSSITSNGKTILSYIEPIPKRNVSQLYFSNETPTIPGYNYFQLTDRDVIRGRFNKNKRGRSVISRNINEVDTTLSAGKHSDFERLLRELIWMGGWISPQLNTWISKQKPNCILFVGGDCWFAYQICMQIAQKFNCRVALYITDDYLTKKSNENLFQIIRRIRLTKLFNRLANKSQSILTISEKMKNEYYELFGFHSITAVNITEPLRCPINHRRRDEKQRLLYAGSLYYGRDKVLGEISQAVENENAIGRETIELVIYSNAVMDDKTKNIMIRGPHTIFGGLLDFNTLKNELNAADILVFVESFDSKYIEKVRLSLSTKVPEYLSLGKPIFAVGGKECGSIEYLSDTALCVVNEELIGDKLHTLLRSQELQQDLSKKALNKYHTNHDKNRIQRAVLNSIVGKDNPYDSV